MPQSPEDLKRVSERDAKIVALADSGIPPRDIADLLGVSRGLVAFRLHRARKRGATTARFDGHGRPIKEPQPATAWSGKLFKRDRLARPAEDRAPTRAPQATYAGAHRSLGGAALGDPRPGQSALDRRCVINARATS